MPVLLDRPGISLLYKAMDQETKEFIKGEFENFAILINKGFETTMQTLRDEIKSEASTLRGEMKTMENGLRGEMKTMGDTLRQEIGSVALEVLAVKKEVVEIKQIVNRIDDRTQHQVEALYEEIRVTQKAVTRIENHVKLSPSFPVAA